MKTNINQMCTIVGFFSTTICATIAISWGMINLIFEPEQCLSKFDNKVLTKTVEIKTDLQKTFKFLIPKTK
jgi:hypothetical protein